MKIISKYKDYYDYLQGVYGIDEKLVLDRRDYDLLPYTPSSRVLRFYIAGYIVEGYWVEKERKCLFGEDLQILKGTGKPLEKCPRDYDKSIYLEPSNDRFSHEWCYTEIVKDKDKINELHNCPILLHWSRHSKLFVKYPILKDFNFPSFIPAEEMFKMLSQWLSEQITRKEVSPDLSNDNKIAAKGFDLKTSFRPKIKS